MRRFIQTRFFRLTLCAAVACFLLAETINLADARPRPTRRQGDFQANKTFGLGLMLGAPTGLSGKVFLSRDTALDFGVGVYGRHRRGDSSLHVHFDFLWHPVLLAKTQPFYLPLYFGIGGRFWDHDWRDDRYADDTHIGIRAPLGIAFDFNNVPLDIFFELAFTLDFIIDDYDYHDGLWADLGAAIGIRYWFD